MDKWLEKKFLFSRRNYNHDEQFKSLMDTSGQFGV